MANEKRKITEPKLIEHEVRKIGKSGNSLSITLPSSFAKKLKLREGEFCDIDLMENDTIIIRKQ